MNSQHKRKTVLVNRRVQGQVLVRVLWLWVLYHVVLWHVMLFFRFIQYCGERLSGGSARPFSDLFAEFVHNHYSMLICAVFVLPYLVWDVLKLTHRFVGPLVQFQRCLTSLARGELVKEVRIRKGDFLGELQDSFNEFLRSPYAPKEGTEVAAASPSPSPQSIAIDDDATRLKADIDSLRASLPAAPEPVERHAASR